MLKVAYTRLKYITCTTSGWHERCAVSRGMVEDSEGPGHRTTLTTVETIENNNQIDKNHRDTSVRIYFWHRQRDSVALVSLIRRGQSLSRAYNRGVLCVRSLILGGIAYSIPSRFRRRRLEEG